jgi:hypothetical protein
MGSPWPMFNVVVAFCFPPGSYSFVIAVFQLAVQKSTDQFEHKSTVPPILSQRS